MNKLDEIALNVEIVLISLIEGVALVTLAEVAMPYLHDTSKLEFLPYILAGLVLLLAFWSQSLMHAISFIRWPINVAHMFMYFVAAFIQIIAYSNIDNISAWFFWWTIFTIVALIMYIVDLRIIRQKRPAFSLLPGGEKYMDAVEQRHLFELKYLVPLALAFNLIVMGVTLVFPSWFFSPIVFAIPGLLQLAISIGALTDCTRNFKTRSDLIPSLYR